MYFVIRNGLPPSISAWAQEYGRAGRDGKQTHAYILYCDNDIQHVRFWALDMARQYRSSDINDSAHQFSLALPFVYAHLAAICRRKLLLESFGEECATICPEYCCDVCQMPAVVQEDRKSELTLLIQAIDELKNMGEVKVTKWLRGGEIAWMQKVTKSDLSAYNRSPPNLSRNGGERLFARFLLLGSFCGLLNQLLLEQTSKVHMLC